MSYKELTSFTLSEEAFEAVLNKYARYVIVIDDLRPYLCGCTDKVSIYYDGSKKFVCNQRSLCFLGHKAPNDWQQCICVLKSGQAESHKKSITGAMAWNKIMERLRKYYSDAEIEECFAAHEAEYDKDKCQWVVNPDHIIDLYPGVDAVLEFRECLKYDMNGAYATRLCQIFPKAKEVFVDLYRKRKSNPVNKDYINYFVGMMNNREHRLTFNWVVQSMREEIQRVAEALDGVIIYAKTDGFIISRPKNNIVPSYDLGGYKLEYTGPVQIYLGENYEILQTGNVITGSMLRSVRDKVDLRIGQVVRYKRVKVPAIKGDKSIYKAEDVEVYKVGKVYG